MTLSQNSGNLLHDAKSRGRGRKSDLALKSFQIGTIGKCIITWWHKATGKKNVTSTQLRKMHAAQLLNADDISKRSAHKLMCHSGRTTETYSMLESLEDMAVRGHSVLTANINLQDISNTKLTPVKGSPSTSNFTQEEFGPKGKMTCVGKSPKNVGKSTKRVG